MRRNWVLYSFLVLAVCLFVFGLVKGFPSYGQTPPVANPQVSPPSTPVADKAEVENKPDISAQARALLEQDRKEREQKAIEEISAICRKYRVTLQPVVVIQGNQVASTVQVKTLQE